MIVQIFSPCHICQSNEQLVDANAGYRLTDCDGGKGRFMFSHVTFLEVPLCASCKKVLQDGNSIGNTQLVGI